MDRAAYAGLNAVEGRHWWFTGRRAVLTRLIRDHIPLPADARILEAGCGTGGNLAMLAALGQLQAFEHDAEARDIAAAKQICAVAPGTLPGPVDLADDSQTLIAMLDVLEHIPDDVGALARLGAALAPDGRLLITVPALPMLWSAHDELHHHQRRYTAASLRAAISAAGLSVERIGYFNSLLFPLALVQRLALRFQRWISNGRGTEAAAVDTVPPATVNRLLGAIFAAEAHLVGRIALPIGLSLFAIVQRP